MARETVACRLERMRDDLAVLVTACNKDGQHDTATRAQVALEAVAAINPDSHIPEEALWPPRIISEDGETHWRTHL